MTSFSLRLLALAAMCVDHAGLTLFPAVGAFRCIGRLAFPLYCFLLTEGFLHTKSLKGYARRLLLLAILSEIPFDLMIFGRMTSGMEQNVFFSLLFGLLALTACDTLRGRPAQAFIVSVTLAMSAMTMRVSYGWLSVALCLCFYYTRQSRTHMVFAASGTLLLYSLSLFLSGVASSWALVSFCSLFSLVPILLYNGRRGPRTPALTFLFYLSYPLHILLLILIRALRIIPPYFLQ